MPLLYSLTGSALLMAAVPFVTTLSRFFSAFAAPVLFRFFHLKDILVWSQALKTVTIVTLFFFTLFYLDSANLYLVYMFVCLLGFLDGWASPSSSALIPEIVDRDKLMKSNSWLESISQTIEIAIWPLGALLVALTGTVSALVITAVLYTVSTLLLSRIYVHKPVFEEQSSPSIRSEAKRGWIFILRRKDVLAITLSGILISSANIIWLASIMYVYVEERLNVSAAWWGYMNSLLVTGLLAASLLTLVRYSTTEKAFKPLLLLMTLMMTLSTLALSVNTVPILAVVLAFTYGFANQLKALLEVTYTQMNVEQDELPYVYAAQEASYLLTFSISVLLFSYLIDVTSVQLVFFSAGMLSLIGFVLLLINQKYFLSIGAVTKQTDAGERKLN
ncbi:MFS transporter [Alteribacter natronophilus]|nr:MFS transporter [Alteribacter natronophilus]